MRFAAFDSQEFVAVCFPTVSCRAGFVSQERLGFGRSLPSCCSMALLPAFLGGLPRLRATVGYNPFQFGVTEGARDV